MNRLSIILLSIIISISVVKAQEALTFSANGFRDGDSLVMRIVDGFSPGKSGCDAVWNFSDVGTERFHTLQYELSGETFTILEDGTLWRTIIQGDTLMLKGFENRHTLIEYDEPLPLLRYPFSFGDSIQGRFHGIGKWCDHTYMRVWGDGITRADAMGTLILPTGDTLRNVIRIHSVRRTWHSNYDAIRTWTALREVVCQEEMRGITPHTSKAVPVITDTYAWYASGWRYPVLRMDTSTDGMGAKMLAVMYPPEAQAVLDYDMENDLLRQQMSMQEGNGYSGGEQDAPVNAISNHDISYDTSTGTATVSFSLTRPASVSLLLSDVAGVEWRSKEQSYDSEGTYTLSLNCSGLRHGQYAMRIVCGSDIYTEKFSIR